MLVTSANVRELRTNVGGYCVEGMKGFCRRHGFVLQEFIKNGAEVEILAGGKVQVVCSGTRRVIDDAQLLKLVKSIGQQ